MRPNIINYPNSISANNLVWLITSVLCLYNSGEMQEALTYFRRALKLDPKSKETREWIDFIEKERAENR